MKRKTRWKRTGAILLASAVLGSVPAAGAGLLTAAAAWKTPVTEFDEETLAKLADNVLEYSEIPGLIEQYNTTFRNQLQSYYNNPDGSSGLTREQLLGLAAELRKEAADLADEAEDRKDDKEISKEAYEEYQNNIRSLKSYASDLEKAARGESKAGQTAVRSLRLLRNQQIVSASGKMRACQTNEDQVNINEKKLEIAELDLNSAKRQAELGLYSAADVLSAQRARNSAATGLQTAKTTYTNGKGDLLMMLGWQYDAEPEVLRIPEPDLQTIAEYDPEADTELAISNNYDLYDTRRASASSFGSLDKKNREIRNAEDSVRMQMSLLYKDVMQKQASYQAAQTKYRTAEADKAMADRKYSLGMLSRREYLDAEVTWLEAVAAKDSAGLDLTEAMETYEWAAAGLIISSSQ